MKPPPTTVEEFMALPEGSIFMEDTWIDPTTGITHRKPVARKACCIAYENDSIVLVTDHRTGDQWTLGANEDGTYYRRRIYL